MNILNYLQKKKHETNPHHQLQMGCEKKRTERKRKRICETGNLLVNLSKLKKKKPIFRAHLGVIMGGPKSLPKGQNHSCLRNEVFGKKSALNVYTSSDLMEKHMGGASPQK